MNRFLPSTNRAAWIGSLAILLPVLVASAQPKTSKSPPQKKSARKVGLEASNTTYDTKTSLLTGEDFTYTNPDKDLTATGKHAVYNKLTKFLTATGNIVIDDPKSHITGDKADVDDSPKKLAIITGSVVITVKPKPEAGGTLPPADKDTDVKQERKRGVVVTCRRVESFWKKKFTIMRGEPVFTQKILKSDGKEVTRVMTCEHVEYDGTTEKAVLFAPVKVKDSDGQEGEYEQNVLVGTKEGEETLSSKGKFKGTFNVDDEEK